MKIVNLSFCGNILKTDLSLRRRRYDRTARPSDEMDGKRERSTCPDVKMRSRYGGLAPHSPSFQIRGVRLGRTIFFCAGPSTPPIDCSDFVRGGDE